MKVSVNKSGQTLGAKGFRTRESILKATANLLEESKGLVPTVATIADRAGVSAATFYVYFAEAGEAVFCLLENLQPEIKALLGTLREPWADHEIYDRTFTFVNTYFEFWRIHVALLRARETFAEAGHQTFKDQRIRTMGVIIAALAKKLRADRRSGATAHDLAGVLVTALERLAAVLTLNIYPGLRVDQEKYIRAATYVIYSSLSGQVARPKRARSGSPDHH
jgi:AcrR family transcriptional regulator